ncbi:MAG: hypothetical protein AVDCRST_MAG27-3738 [uncultured Craurococcus sp.]|uniref:Glyoxalase-like domain-containing protein n=1 Tax=uncultured Craurococcus sp. TaxID=1135998 RepID=A0A6J4JA54_9PROT|nr:MAG: hypothetical protein AVDCRST_MAG27-3738 [uncultured Craurococcus sp.]
MAEIDHIVIGARSLAEGAAYVAQHLGVTAGPGGAHPGFGTHNLLLGLGPACYLEVIALDPAQPDPPHPRLFDLDAPATALRLEAGPTLITWVARTPVLEAVIARLGPRGGEIRPMRRGDLAWRMAFPPAGQAMEGLIPALIQWDGEGAAARLPDSGVRLLRLEGEHPDADAARAGLAERGLEEALSIRRSPHARLVARLRRADGTEVTLSSG